MIKDSFGGLEELPSKVRNQVRKSLKTYDVKRVSKDFMLHECFDLYNKSRERFGEKDLLVDKKWWADRLSGNIQEYWVVADKETGALGAFSINTVYDDYCNYNTMGISPDVANSTYPIYGLLFEMNRYYLEEKKVKYVMDGARSITEHSNIQPFLEDKFKFRKAYCNFQVFYQPWFGMVVKMLFPFRRWVKHRKVAAILRQEAWARGLEK